MSVDEVGSQRAGQGSGRDRKESERSGRRKEGLWEEVFHMGSEDLCAGYGGTRLLPLVHKYVLHSAVKGGSSLSFPFARHPGRKGREAAEKERKKKGGLGRELSLPLDGRLVLRARVQKTNAFFQMGSRRSSSRTRLPPGHLNICCPPRLALIIHAACLYMIQPRCYDLCPE